MRVCAFGRDAVPPAAQSALQLRASLAHRQHATQGEALQAHRRESAVLPGEEAAVGAAAWPAHGQAKQVAQRPDRVPPAPQLSGKLHSTQGKTSRLTQGLEAV